MKKLIIFGIFFIAVLLCSCRKDNLPDPAPGPDIIEFKGEFELSTSDPNSPDELTVLSVIDESGISADGTFKMESIKNTKYQIFIVSSKLSDEVLYYGISNPESGKVIVNDSTTALGILLINPYLIGSEQEQRKQFLDQAVLENKFTQFIAAIKQSRILYPDKPLSFEQNPDLYQLSNEITMAVMEKLGAGISDSKYGEKLIEIYDVPGNNKVVFKNYRHIFYAAEIYYPSKSKTETFLLSRKEKVLEWRWWPLSKIGFHFLQPAATNSTIDDGLVKIDFYGMNLGELGHDLNAIDKATVYNLLFSFYYTLDMLVGLASFDDGCDVGDLPMILSMNRDFKNMIIALIEGNSDDLINSLFQFFISDPGKGIIKEYLKVNITESFSKAAIKKFNAAFIILDVLGFANEHIPFFADLIRGPLHKSFNYSSSNGVLTAITDNLPPEVIIKTTPGVGFGETQVSFSVDYIDDYTPVGEALFSWKWVADGSSGNEIWSIPAVNPDTVLTLGEPGRMYLKVNDQTDGETQTCKKLSFYESVGKSRIVVLAGHDLSNYGNGFLADSLGYYNEGSGLSYILTYPLQTCDLNGQNFYPSILNPKTDLLVIDPSVNDWFCPGQETGNPVMEAFLDNKLAIANFVRNGGNLLFITSWNTGYEGNMVPLPLISVSDNKVIMAPYSNRQFITGAESYMGTALAFNKIPDKSVVHLVNQNNDPLLVEIKIGEGMILNSVFKTFYTGLPGEPIHHPVNVNTFRYMIGAVYK